MSGSMTTIRPFLTALSFAQPLRAVGARHLFVLHVPGRAGDHGVVGPGADRGPLDEGFG